MHIYFFNSAQSQLLAGIATIWAAVGLRWTLLERTTWCTLLLIAILSAATLPVSVMCMHGTGIVHGLHSFDGSWYREQGTWWPQTHTYTHVLVTYFAANWQVFSPHLSTAVIVFAKIRWHAELSGSQLLKFVLTHSTASLYCIILN